MSVRFMICSLSCQTQSNRWTFRSFRPASQQNDDCLVLVYVLNDVSDGEEFSVVDDDVLHFGPPFGRVAEAVVGIGNPLPGQPAIARFLNEALDALPELRDAIGDLDVESTVERTRDSTHGDFASNLAMRLAKPARL